MEQNKLETQFKEKLNSREIKPTDMAWDRLNAMLSVAEQSNNKKAKQKPKHKWTWMYIAASFIGLSLIATVFLNQKENPIDTKINTAVIEKSSPKENSKNEIKSIKQESDFPKTILNSETKPLVQTQRSNNPKVENLELKTQGNVLAETQPKNESLLIVEHKNGIPTNIDSLLASVEEKSNSDFKKSSIKINSNTLLNQVDGELQLSFREKALNSITKKYKEAKEALVNRNNQ